MRLSNGLIATVCGLIFLTHGGFVAEGFGRSPLLPHVSTGMEQAEFWIKKIRNPTRLLLSPEEIQRINDENLKRPDFYLCHVRDLKEEWTREELLALLKEDWEGFGETSPVESPTESPAESPSESNVRFGRDGRQLTGSFWKQLRNNLNEDQIRERNRIRYGLIVKRTPIRVFPTDEPSLSSPTDSEFDRFQHSMISPGSLVAIFHESRDQRWFYLQAPFIRGWVSADAVGIAADKAIALGYDETEERLMVTGSFVTFFSDPSMRHKAFIAQMGSSFPIEWAGAANPAGRDQPFYVIKIPCRDKNGQLILQNGYVAKRKDVHPGLLPFTQTNLARQAFKMLHEPYGWGELSGGRDCSRLIMDVLATSGLLMPRNSKFQAQVGTRLEDACGKSVREKERALDRALPFATILRLSGHVMLYVGRHGSRYYVIHSIWGFQDRGRSGPLFNRIGRVVVSDLTLGEGGPKGSLLERVTDIRTLVQTSLTNP